MISIPIEFVETEVLSKEFRLRLNKHIEKKQGKLRTLSSPHDQNTLTYLADHLKEIVYATPEGLDQTFRPKFQDLANGIKARDSEAIKLGDDIRRTLSYGTFKKNFIREFFYRLGIKACPYCNSNQVLTIPDSAPEKFKQLYQNDHYWPQSIYPAFSISLYNFVPACWKCNHNKSDHFVHFQLYCSKPTGQQKSQFKFSLTPDSVVENLLYPKKPLKCAFEDQQDRPELNLEGQYWKEPDAVFNISEIYNQFPEIAQEITWKAQAYTPKFRQSLKESFPILNQSPDLVDRLILGNVTHESEIHQRPFAKFMQDIARQQGLLPKELDL